VFCATKVTPPVQGCQRQPFFHCGAAGLGGWLEIGIHISSATSNEDRKSFIHNTFLICAVFSERYRKCLISLAISHDLP
jgi:hypothetical protein